MLLRETFLTKFQVDTSFVTTTTSTTETLTASATINPTITQTVTCGAPAPTDVISNGGFECDTLTPWTVYNQLGGDTEAVVAPGDNSNYALKTESNYYAQSNGGNAGATFGQTLNTTPGVTYQISFDLHIDGGGGNFWSVYINNENPIASGEGGFNGWNTYTGTFTATSSSDQLNVQFYSVTWAYADYYWDNFVITPA